MRNRRLYLKHRRMSVPKRKLFPPVLTFPEPYPLPVSAFLKKWGPYLTFEQPKVRPEHAVTTPITFDFELHERINKYATSNDHP